VSGFVRMALAGGWFVLVAWLYAYFTRDINYFHWASLPAFLTWLCAAAGGIAAIFSVARDEE
jgi:hypothetical protein